MVAWSRIDISSKQDTIAFQESSTRAIDDHRPLKGSIENGSWGLDWVTSKCQRVGQKQYYNTERWEELFEKRPMGCAVYSINYLVKVVESILELVPWGARCWKNPWRALFCFSPFYILPPIVVTLLYTSLILASYIKDVGECIKVCIVAGGGAMLSVTFAGQPVKGAKRILTTENKSSFQKIQKHFKRNLSHTLPFPLHNVLE